LIHYGYLSPHLNTDFLNAENRAFAPASIGKASLLPSNRRSQLSGLPINSATESVTVESLLGDSPENHHPPCGKRRLLYLGIGCRPEARSPKSFFLSGFGDAVIRDGEFEETSFS
jgi:hypothetical protein